MAKLPTPLPPPSRVLQQLGAHHAASPHCWFCAWPIVTRTPLGFWMSEVTVPLSSSEPESISWLCSVCCSVWASCAATPRKHNTCQN